MKYNSIGEQLIAKAQELDPNYKPDKFNDMSEAIDVILNNTGSSGGGDIWLDITPYLNENMTSISQEGYDLLYNGIMINNKYCGIVVGESHVLYYLEYVGNLFFEQINPEENGKSYIFGIYQDLHTVFAENPFIENPSGSSKIWYNIGNINLFDPQPITQEQYNEMKTLAESDSLAGIVSRFDTIAYIPLQHIDNGTFTFQSLSYGKDDFQNFTNDSFTITIKHDLSVSLSLDQKPLFSIPTQGGVFIPCASGAVQQNLNIGSGLEIKDGALKTTIPPLPSDASTKTYNLKAVNGILTWSE